jgi:hypothetical protein
MFWFNMFSLLYVGVDVYVLGQNTSLHGVIGTYIVT